MNASIKVLFLSLVTTVCAMAQAQQTPVPAEAKSVATTDISLPPIDEILEKYTQALGGKAPYEKLTTRVMKGTFELPAMGVTANAEIYSKAPNKQILIIDIPGFGMFQQGYDGTAGWAQDPQTGLRDMTASEQAVAKRGADFLQAFKLKENFPKMELKGKEKVGERDAYVIEGKPAEGGPVKLYFDKESGLLTKVEMELETPQGKVAFENVFEDYREVDGVKIPFTTRRSSTTLNFVIKVQEVKHNEPIDDAKFKKPEPPKPANP